MQKQEGSSWLLLSWELLWEWGVRSSSVPYIFLIFIYLFFELWDDLALLYALQSLPICYLWHFCLRLLTTGLVLSHILKTQEKSTVEIVNMVIWRRKVTEQREDMMILKGMLVWHRNKSILPAFFSPTRTQQIVAEQQAFSNMYTKENLWRIPKGLGRTIKSCWQLSRLQCSVH